MNDDEDLFDNPFFMGLKKQYAAQYAEIETACHVVLVPSAESLTGVNITKDLIDAHIFHLAPESQTKHVGVFDTTKVVDIKRGQVTLLAGFEGAKVQSPSEANGANGSSSGSAKLKAAPKHQSIPIKFEELFYNKAAEAFRVICIEHPTTGRSGQGGDMARLSEIRTFDECQSFLFSDYMNAFVLTKLEKTFLADFIARFGRGPSSESEIAVRTAELVDQIINQLVCANHEWKEIQNKRKAMMRQLELIVETWTLGRVGPTVMSALMQSFDLVDREVHRVLRANQGITLHNLNLRSELICDFSTAIELASQNFDRISSPIEKLILMQEIIENIQRTIELSYSMQGGSRISDNVLASDDLIPIIVFVLLQAKPQHLNATLYYVKHFTRSNIKTSQMGFHLATFTAAAEFIKTDHLPQSGFGNLQSSGDYIAHPLDPVRSPHFDPYAAGIETSTFSRTENRRSMSYITPPVTTSAISTGRSFGTKSSTSTPSSENADYGFTMVRPNLSRSISTYDHSRSYSTGGSERSTSSPKRSDYGSMSTTQLPIYPQYGTTTSQPVLVSQPPKGPESITLTPEESRMFFSNLKSFGASSAKGSR